MMSPVIRVDDDVWAWLQAQAKPFVDTPNTVLRRLADLDRGEKKPPSDTKENSTARANWGKKLNERYKLGAKHALFHKDGKWFNLLTAFPGVLCDPDGYLKYETQEQFESDQRLHRGQELNVPDTIARHPHYKLFPKS